MLGNKVIVIEDKMADGKWSGDDVTRSNDPRLLASRLFLGNLPTDKCTKQDIYEHFCRYGNILGLFSYILSSPSLTEIHFVYVAGILLFKGYGFLQFKEVQDAKIAVISENHEMFMGQRMGK